MRMIGSLIVLLFVASNTQAQPQPTGAVTATHATITLAELERIALEKNPTLQAAQASVDAARGRARQAGAWPNPVAGYSAEEITMDDLNPRGEHGFFIAQTIPLGGKLRLGRSVFDRTADQAEAVVELQRHRIVSSVRQAFFETLTMDRRVEVHERLAALASEAVAITAQLYNVGSADRPDYLEAQIEARRLQLDLNAAKDRAFALRQHLAAVVGSTDVAARPLSGSVDQALPELEREEALRTVLEQSPQLRAARAGLTRAQAITASARRATFPDLFLRGGAAYNREQSDHSVNPVGWQAAFEAGFSVPLFNRNAGAVGAARAEETRAQAELMQMELLLRSRLASQFATYLTALRAAETYRSEILPRAEEAYRLYLARYREMGAAYPQVLIAQRNLFEMSSAYLENLEDAWRSALQIEGFLAGDGLQSPGLDGETSETVRTRGDRGERP